MKKILTLALTAFIINTGYSFNCLDNLKLEKNKENKFNLKHSKPKRGYKKGIKNVTDDGFFINAGTSFYSKNFFMQKGLTNDSKYRFGLGPNLEVGNMFRAFWSDNAVLGIRVSWLTLNYSCLKAENKSQYQVLQASLLKFGPYFTAALSNEMGFDIFAQISPTYLYNTKDTTGNNGYAGFPYVLGFDIRYEGITIGTDFNIGTASLVDEHANNLFTKPQIGYLRIFIGYKF
jgi:hypothetical protein